jgi:hypothetical protein
MVYKTNHNERLERVMNQLADSVLELSDEAILAEVRETGADPDEEAEHTRQVLRQASRALEDVNRRVSNLGHTLDPKYWRRADGAYHNKCLNCGSVASVAMASGEMQGLAVTASCREIGHYMIARREASRK